MTDLGRSSIPRYAELAQGDQWRIAERLLIYAVETGRTDALMRHVGGELGSEYESVLSALGGRSFTEAEGDVDLPVRYQKALALWRERRDEADVRRSMKERAATRIRELCDQKDVSLRALARDTGVDYANLCAFANRGQTHRLSHAATRSVLRYLVTL